MRPSPQSPQSTRKTTQAGLQGREDAAGPALRSHKTVRQQHVAVQRQREDAAQGNRRTHRGSSVAMAPTTEAFTAVATGFLLNSFCSAFGWGWAPHTCAHSPQIYSTVAAAGRVGQHSQRRRKERDGRAARPRGRRIGTAGAAAAGKCGRRALTTKDHEQPVRARASSAPAGWRARKRGNR